MFRNLPTFKSLPSAIGLPFLSSQEDAQLKFRSGENGIKRLYSEEVIPLSDFGYWAQYYTLFNSAQDVYSLISVQDVRQTLQSNPTNLANLLSNLSHHLFTLLPSPLFPGTSSSSSPQNPTQELLNCLRVLGRVIVVIYESEADARDKHIWLEETFAWKWLWRRMKVTEVKDRGYEMGEELEGDELGAETETSQSGGTVDDMDEGGQFTIADEDDSEDEEGGDIGVDEGARAFKAVVGNPAKQDSPTKSTTVEETEDPLQAPTSDNDTAEHQEEEEETIPCLIDRLFSCTIDLLFCAGFTVPESVRGVDGDKINYVIWEKGVGSTVNVGSSADLDRNKTEVLRFLMILLSTTIYLPPSSLPTTPNLPLEHLTHSLERRLVLSLLCSLLNTSLTSKANTGVTGQIPYNHLISKGAEERRILVKASMMTLLVALDYKKVSTSQEMGEGKDDNAFRYFVSKLHRKEDFAFILQGILGILEEHSQVVNGYLPGSKKPIPYILETFMLFWRMIDLNKRFRAYLYDSGKAVDITIYILLTSLELKDDPANHGLLRLLSYVLQTLSADKAFAECLNQSIRLGVPAKWAVAGTAADFLIVSIYSIATTPGLNPLFPALTISISNISPHLRNLGVQASTRLMQLFKAFSAPSFLLADEGHPRLVYYLLETINSILYHQFNENPNFVYSVLRSHQDFQTLATFTLMSGLRDIQKKKASRAAAAEARKDTSKGLQRSNSEMDMIAEKASLLSTHQDEDDIPRLTSDQISPMDERRDPALSIVTPSENTIDPMTISSGMSEKARGKMRAVEDGDEEVVVDVADEELLKVANAGVGPGGYVPTQEWVSSWQKGLPLDPVLVAISELLPKIQDTQRPSGAPSSKIFNLLKDPTTFESLLESLPPSLPIQSRRFQWSTQSSIWLTSLLWGDIYVAGLSGLGIWRDTTVRLFGVKQAVERGRGAQVGRVLRRFGVV